MSSGMQVTENVLRISKLFLSSTAELLCGSVIANTLGINLVTTYGVLKRLERNGWLQGSQENIQPHIEHRAPRRLYEITPKGATQARGLLMAST